MVSNSCFPFQKFLCLFLVLSLLISCSGSEDRFLKVDPLKGASGEAGTQGERGLQGEQGSQGIQGEKGEKGDKGEDGAPGLVGAQGPAGLQGPIGPQGPQGIQGVPGVAGSVGPQGPKGDTGETGPAGAGALGGFQFFTSDSTFTVPDGVTKIKVEAWGAGGGGAGAFQNSTYCSGGGAGGGGGYAFNIFTVVPSTVYAITVGAGGAAGANSPALGGAATPGSTGGTTSVVGLLSAQGGNGGIEGQITIVGSSGTGGTANAGTDGLTINGRRGTPAHFNYDSTFPCMGGIGGDPGKSEAGRGGEGGGFYTTGSNAILPKVGERGLVMISW